MEVQERWTFSLQWLDTYAVMQSKQVLNHYVNRDQGQIKGCFQLSCSQWMQPSKSDPRWQYFNLH